MVQGERDFNRVKTRVKTRGLKMTSRVVGHEGRQKVRIVKIY